LYGRVHVEDYIDNKAAILVPADEKLVAGFCARKTRVRRKGRLYF
jgi:hypothetical protein